MGVSCSWNVRGSWHPGGQNGSCGEGWRTASKYPCHLECADMTQEGTRNATDFAAVHGVASGWREQCRWRKGILGVFDGRQVGTES